jgi:two-component system chemotaxis response regulator CheB
MRPIRVLIVDDAVVVRRLVADVLSADPMLEVIGTAANGRIALARIPQVNPDLVTLDVEMPEMDGLQTLMAIRKTYPRLPVIMFSTLTDRGAATTIDALTMGANDYVTKPANVGSVAVAMQRVREELIPKIKALCADTAGIDLSPGRPGPVRPLIQPRPASPASGQQRIDIVAIGVSTGGPNALAALLPALPADLPVPIVIVQHMPPLFTRLLAERLATQSAMQVKEGIAGAILQPAQVWIAPGDYHMVLRRQETAVQLFLHQEPPEHFCRPAVDVLFRSVAETYGAHTLAVVLTGMGQDGWRGCEHIREAGGQVLAQDEATSVVWGMPGFVVKAGLADQVLPLPQLAADIINRVYRGRDAAAATALI